MEDTNSEQTTTQAIKLKKEKVVKGITCPSCGGELDLKEGMKTFNCKFCNTLLMAKGESGTMKYYVPKSIKRDAAINNAFHWLGHGVSKAKGLKSNSKIDEAFLVYIPYWRVRADVVGWVFGQEKHTSGNSTTYEDKEIKIQSSFDRTYPACDIAELGVKKVNLEGDEILPVNFENLQQDGMMFNIVSSEKEIYDESLSIFTEQARKDASLDSVSFEHYDLVRQNVSIVYYPLWVIRYVYQNRTYQVVVDGQDGTICYGKAPGNNLFRAVAGVIGIGVGMYLATFFEVFSILNVSTKGPWIAFVILLIIGILIMVWGYKKFRYGGEVENGTGLVAEDKTNFIEKTATKYTGSSNVKGLAKSAVGSIAVGAIVSSIFDSD
jgi:ssDNA-binding Zn-finger/Zn-ribbon topoisomerase 1